MLTQFFTQERRFRPTRKLKLRRSIFSSSRPQSSQKSRVAWDWLVHLLEYTYPLPKHPGMGIFHVQPLRMAIAEV